MPKGIFKGRRLAHLETHFAVSLDNERLKESQDFFCPGTSPSPKTWSLCVEGLKPELHSSDIFWRMGQVRQAAPEDSKMGRKWKLELSVFLPRSLALEARHSYRW